MADADYERTVAELDVLITRLTTDVQALRDGTLTRARTFELARLLEHTGRDVQGLAVTMPRCP